MTRARFLRMLGLAPLMPAAAAIAPAAPARTVQVAGTLAFVDWSGGGSIGAGAESTIDFMVPAVRPPSSYVIREFWRRQRYGVDGFDLAWRSDWICQQCGHVENFGGCGLCGVPGTPCPSCGSHELREDRSTRMVPLDLVDDRLDALRRQSSALARALDGAPIFDTP